MVSMSVTHGLSRVPQVCIDFCFKVLINTMALPKRGLPDGRALLQSQLFQQLWPFLFRKTELWPRMGYTTSYLNS